MVDHKRKLYKFDSETDTVFVNEYSLQLRSEIKAPVSGVFDDPSASLTCCKTFWISFGNDLFFVKKVNLDDSKKIIIRVYKLDEEEQIFVPVTSLGNKALFLCCDHSFGVVVPQEFNKIGEGLIYFLEVDPPSPREHSNGLNYHDRSSNHHHRLVDELILAGYDRHNRAESALRPKF
ncbi:hypothetical protein ACFE04_022520 [Oxalis oulophora]